MRILLTEVTGELGRALAQSLLAAGHDVYGIAARAHRDLDPGVDFVSAALSHPVLYRLAELADVVVPLPDVGSDTTRAVDVARVCDAAGRGGARIVFPSLSLLAPRSWQQAEDLVSTGWAPSLVVRIAAPMGRQTDALVCRSVAALLDTDAPGPVHVLHIDDLIRFLVRAVGTDRTGVVDLGGVDTTSVASARRLLGGADPRPRVRGVPGWRQLCPPLDLGPLRTEWGFECGWAASDAVVDTVRGLHGRRVGPAGAAAIPGRIPLPVNAVPRSVGNDAASDGAEGEFDDRIDQRFPMFVASPLTDAGAGPLTPMSLDLHLTGLRLAGRSLTELLDLRGPIADEWAGRLVAAFGHRIYLGASALAAAEPRLPARAAALSRRLRAATDGPVGGPGLLAAVTGALSTSRLLSEARLYGRQLRAYRDAAEAERREGVKLGLLRDAQLDARIRLLRSRIHEGWTLTALAVVLAEVAPAQLDGADQPVSIRAEVDSLARVLRAHPYARAPLEAGDMGAVHTGAPMLANAFEAALAHIGHRGPGGVELATSVLGDRPDAVLAAAARVRGAGFPEVPPLPGAYACRVLAYDTTLRFTHQLRLAVREVSRRLVADDKIAAPDDVFQLTIEEALAVPADTRLRIKRRIAERERLQAIRLPAVIDTAWTPIDVPVTAQVEEELNGTGLFPGVAEGTVRVVDSAADAGLTADDIAVVAGADVEAVALLGTPAAILTGDGVVFGEQTLRVPFVAGIPGRLCTGMRVRVDGSAGLVTVLAPACDVVGV
jgi:nucleoside-diphosphate-sugar epimerase